MSFIAEIVGREILDSRGNPTVEVDVLLSDGFEGRASVPSGASTGSHEAIEKRDGDSSRYCGKGVLKTIEVINGKIQDALVDVNVLDQKKIDKILIELDGTSNKEKLGANALLGVSLAVAKAAAASVGLPLFKYIGGVTASVMPVPLMNVLNGGMHADNSLQIQEFMIVPVGAKSFTEALRMGTEVFHSLKNCLKSDKLSINVGDEGGFAPNVASTKEALSYLENAIEKSGFILEEDIALALDVAASEFYKDGVYQFNNQTLSNTKMIDFYEELIKEFPIISIEDGLAENDWDGWKEMTARLGSKIQLVGDDIFVTNHKRLSRGIDEKSANAVLVKPNQIGTLSETLNAIDTTHKNGWKAVVSHRSGETEDTTIADLAVAKNCGQIKTGSLCRTDRVAKYNQLLRIEQILGDSAVYLGKNAFGIH